MIEIFGSRIHTYFHSWWVESRSPGLLLWFATGVWWQRVEQAHGNQ